MDPYLSHYMRAGLEVWMEKREFGANKFGQNELV